jgi:hypothetical protein
LIEEAMNRKSKIQNTRLLIEESVSNNPVPSKDKESTKDIKSETEKTDLVSDVFSFLYFRIDCI